MSAHNIQLGEDDFRFVEEKAKGEGISVSQEIERLIAFLRRVEERPIHPDVLALMGILRGIDPNEAKSAYLSAKHL